MLGSSGRLSGPAHDGRCWRIEAASAPMSTAICRISPIKALSRQPILVDEQRHQLLLHGAGTLALGKRD